MKIAHNYFVYIVECTDNSYYTGVTNNLERRIWEHNSGENQLSYTFKRCPVILKFSQWFQDINQAIEFEKQVKSWSRKKKEALFIEDWEEIKRLAKSKTAIHEFLSSKSDIDTTPSSTSSD